MHRRGIYQIGDWREHMHGKTTRRMARNENERVVDFVDFVASILDTHFSRLWHDRRRRFTLEGSNLIT